MPFANYCRALLKFLLGLGLLSSCRSENVAFQLPLPTPIANPKQPLTSAVKSGCPPKDSVVMASALVTSATKGIRLAAAAMPAGRNRFDVATQRKNLQHLLFIAKPLEHKKPIASQAGNASNGWKGFGEFLLLASLPLALFGALTAGIFNVSFLVGLAYAALGFVALFFLLLLAVGFYWLYKLASRGN